ncbi:MAG: hypothetical protein ACT4OY_04410 [Alphaproteobacteria bacterium]
MLERYESQSDEPEYLKHISEIEIDETFFSQIYDIFFEESPDLCYKSDYRKREENKENKILSKKILKHEFPNLLGYDTDFSDLSYGFEYIPFSRPYPTTELLSNITERIAYRLIATLDEAAYKGRIGRVQIDFDILAQHPKIFPYLPDPVSNALAEIARKNYDGDLADFIGAFRNHPELLEHSFMLLAEKENFEGFVNVLKELRYSELLALIPASSINKLINNIHKAHNIRDLKTIHECLERHPEFQDTMSKIVMEPSVPER